MKRQTTVKAYVEHVESFEQTQFTLDCRTPKGRFKTSVLFDPQAPHYTWSFKRYGLFKRLCAIHGINERDAIDLHFMLFAFRYFTFRLEEFRPGVWIIDAAGPCEPFSFDSADVYTEADHAAVEELFRVR